MKGEQYGGLGGWVLSLVERLLHPLSRVAAVTDSFSIRISRRTDGSKDVWIRIRGWLLWGFLIGYTMRNEIKEIWKWVFE
jgi:hypothetical protein